MKKLTLAFMMASLLMTNAAYACKPVHPKYRNNTPAFLLLSSNQQAMVKVVQERFAPNQKGDWVISRPSRMEAYQLNNDGQLKLLWSAKDIYPNLFPGEFLLADGGMYLVRIKGASTVDDKDALTIYRNGKIFRRYAPKDFMPTLKTIQVHTCGFGPWLKDNNPPTLNGTLLSLQTIDGKKWSFDILQPLK